MRVRAAHRDSETGVEPGRMELHRITRTRKNGEWTNEKAKNDYEKMMKMMQDNQAINDDDEEDVTTMTEDQIVQDVLLCIYIFYSISKYLLKLIYNLIH
ncbi:hypothetical protein Sjap_006477 [Stephania japonica]|uniref:Uncharacterized protein n=1 Tax=Stephania japonica TaxID=461633 RepID=A0AAP0PL34_9MAGN